MPTGKRTAYNPKGGSKPKKSSSRPKSASLTIPASVTVDKDSRVDVEQIENGFLVRESGSKGKGRNMTFYEKKFFTPTNPVKIQKPAMKFSGKKK